MGAHYICKCGKPMASQVSRCPDCGYLGPHRFVSKPEDANGSSDGSPQVKKAGPGRRDDFNLDASDKGLSLTHGTERFTEPDSDAPIEFSHPARGIKDKREVPFNIRQSNEALDAALSISKTERKEFRKGRDKADELDYADESDEKYDSEYDESEDEGQGRGGTGKVSAAIVSIILVILFIIGAVYVINNFEEVTKWLAAPTIPEFFKPSGTTSSGNLPWLTQTPSVNTPPQTQSPSDGSASNIVQPAPATAMPPTISSPQSGKTPPVISGIKITERTEHGATVTWNISEPCMGNLSYKTNGGPSLNRKIENLSSFHTENITDLESGKTYLVTIEMLNKDNIVSTEKTSFTTLASTADTTPPQLVGQPDIAVSDATATITWKTGEKSTAIVKYGLSTGYEFTSIEDRELRTEHSIYISALSPSTTYHFQVISKDAAGNEMKEGNFQFKTDYQTDSAPYIGSKAPSFTLKTIDGREVSLNQYRGKKVILNFWASWCSPCKIELPHFQAFWDKYSSSSDVMLLTVAGSSSDVKVLEDIIATNGYNFTVCLDSSEDLFNRYSIISIPQTYFIDKVGTIRRMQQGMFTSPAEIEFVLSSFN